MEQIAKFTLNVPKHAKALAKFASTDPYREALNYICIEPQRGFMAATDTHMMQVINTECSGQWPEASKNQFGNLVNFCVLIDPKHIAKIAGKAITVTVFTEQRQKEVTRKVGTRAITEVVTHTYHIAEIECNGATYATDIKKMHFPDVWRVIPRPEGRRAIRLTPESIDVLKTFCKLNKNKEHIALDVKPGSNTAILCASEDYSEARTAVMLELAEDSELTMTIGLNPAYLLTCMDGCNGVITFKEECTPVVLEGIADTTLLMPTHIGKEAEFARKLRKERVLSGRTFAESAAEVVKQLQMAANDVWNYLKECNTHNGKCALNPGNYTAKDVANFKHGAVWKNDDEPVKIEYGRICMQVEKSRIFATLAAWESATRSAKSIFSIGNVEEISATVLEPNGDEVAENKMKLRVLGGGWYSPVKRNKRDWDAPVYCEVNGSIIFVRNLSIDTIDDAEAFAAFAEGKAEQIPSMIVASAKGSKYFATLAERLGIEASTPTETPQISTTEGEVEKVSAEGESEPQSAEMPEILNCEWQTIEDFKKIPNIGKLTANGVFIRGVGYHTEYFRKLDSNAEFLARVDNLPWDNERHDFPYQGSGIFGETELFDNWDDAVIATIDALTQYLQKQKEPPEVAPQSKGMPTSAQPSTPPPKAVRKHRTTETTLN